MDINKPEFFTAIIAASAALSGVIISQIISIILSFIDKRHNKFIMLRQKYEEMMFHFQDSLMYYKEVGACRNLDQLLQNNHSISSQRAMGLALLYFPELVPAIEEYIRNQVSFYLIVVSKFNSDIPSTAAAQARVHNKLHIEEIERKLFNSKDRVIAELKANLNKYIKA